VDVVCSTSGSLILRWPVDPDVAPDELASLPCARDELSRRGLSGVSPVGGVVVGVGTAGVSGGGVDVAAGVAGVVVGSVHAPLVQTPLSQTVPQVPQLVASVARS
jgi:hypothetical protein